MESLASSQNRSLDLNSEDHFYFGGSEPQNSETSPAQVMAEAILSLVMKFRRVSDHHGKCSPGCPVCQAPHLPRVLAAVKSGKPVSFVLPAFPGKSPNLAKVLGAAPDMAEELALKFLQSLCNRIQMIYRPGAKITLCSDGRVFSDVVGMDESDVTAYQAAIAAMIAKHNLKSLSTFDLDEMGLGEDFVQMRETLMVEFGVPLESLQEKVRAGASELASSEEIEANHMYKGITRFLVEDAFFPGQQKSRTAVQKECKVKAYEVIRRSNAWSELIAKKFPKAVRLSIHPQACGAKKLGLRLIGNESWITPWHGVAVKLDGAFVLMKRAEAEARGANLVLDSEGRPSHFELGSK